MLGVILWRILANIYVYYDVRKCLHNFAIEHCGNSKQCFIFPVGKRWVFDYALPVGVSKRRRNSLEKARSPYVFSVTDTFLSVQSNFAVLNSWLFEANQSAHKTEFHVR